jgi:hypothetical protein
MTHHVSRWKISRGNNCSNQRTAVFKHFFGLSQHVARKKKKIGVIIIFQFSTSYSHPEFHSSPSRSSGRGWVHIFGHLSVHHTEPASTRATRTSRRHGRPCRYLAEGPRRWLGSNVKLKGHSEKWHLVMYRGAIHHPTDCSAAYRPSGSKSSRTSSPNVDLKAMLPF